MRVAPRSLGLVAMLSFDESCLALSLRMHTTAPASSASNRAATLRTPTPFMAPPLDEPCSFIDIGANLLDPQFLGQYNGKQKHECDLAAVFDRAAEQVQQQQLSTLTLVYM